MRTIFELWLIVEQNFEEYFDYCLCDTIVNIYKEGLITDLEKENLKHIVAEYGWRRFKKRRDSLLWEENCKKPRRMFIQKQILKIIRNE